MTLKEKIKNIYNSIKSGNATLIIKLLMYAACFIFTFGSFALFYKLA